MTPKKRVITIIIVLVVIILAVLGVLFVILHSQKSEIETNQPSVSVPVSTPETQEVDFVRIKTILNGLGWDRTPEANLPIVNGFPTMPEKYIQQILYYLPTQTNYISKINLNGTTGTWDIYDFSNGKFQEIYSPYYVESEGSTIGSFIFNQNTKKIIVISNDVQFAHDINYIKELIRIFEISDYYKDPSRQYLEIQTTYKGDLGYEIQFGFFTMLNPFLNNVVWGIGILDGDEWQMDYETTKSYKTFIESIGTDEKGEKRKQELLNL